jgi:demethylmenaquinone methyltransferase/2-methoxy-6-polyprenyl-1,4-benzoquinol methylase
MSDDGLEITRVTRSKDSARASYDRLSKWYDLLAGSSEKKFAEVGLRGLDVKAGEKVLEIGFGTGHSLLALAQMVGASGKVYGIDLSRGMFQITCNRIKKSGMLNRVELHCGDATQLPYEDGFFDAIFMSFVLELFDTPGIPLVMRECFRVLHSNGRISIVSLSKKKGMAINLYEWFHVRFPSTIDCRPIYTRKIIEDIGFQTLDVKEMMMWGLPVDIALAQKAN